MNNHALRGANLLERIGHLSRTDEKSAELYPAQWAALRYLSQANRFSRTPMAIARYLGTTRGTTSQTLTALERKGLVTRVPSMRDKRSVNIELTKDGREVLQDDPILRLVSSIDGALGSQAKQLEGRLEKVLGKLIELNGGRKFGECQTCRHFLRGQGNTSDAPHFCGLLEEPLSDSDRELICVEQE